MHLQAHYEYGSMKALGVATSSELWYNMGSVSALNSFGYWVDRATDGIIHDAC